MGENYLRQARIIETARFGIPHPSGLAFLPATGNGVFFVMSTYSPVKAKTGPADIAMISSVRQWIGSLEMRAPAVDPINMAYDAKAKRLYLLAANTKELIELGLGADGYPDPATTVRIEASRFGLQNPRGIRITSYNVCYTKLLRLRPDFEDAWKNMGLLLFASEESYNFV